MNQSSPQGESFSKRLHATVKSIRAQSTVAAIVMEGFFTRLGFGMIGFALPLYALSIGMSIAEIGILYALRSMITLLIKPIMGWVADRFGPKRVLVGAVLLRCLVGFLYIFAAVPWQLFAIRGLQGAMTAARDPSAMSLIAEHGNKQRMASTFAWYITARDLGRSLGYGAAGILITLLSYQWVFFIAFLTSCAALYTVIRYVRDHKEPPVKSVNTEASRFKEVKSNNIKSRPPAKGKFIQYAFFGLMVMLTSEMMRGLFPIIAVQYAHLSVAQAGIAASAASIVIVIAGPLFGWLSDRGNRKWVLSARGIANTGSSLLYIFVPNFSGFLTGRLLDDTGKAAFRPAWGSLLAELSESNKNNRAQTMAVLDTSMNVGEILGPIIAATLISVIGIPAMLTVRICLAFFTEIQAFLIFKK